jgi:sugar lactone lactonase YvrE
VLVCGLEERTLLSLIATATSVSTSTTSPAYGQAVTFTATVATFPPGGATPTGGTVTFRDGAATLGTAPLVAGTAMFTTAAPLSVGVHSIVASYSGDGTTFAGSVSTVGVTSAFTQINLPIVPSGLAVDGTGDVFIADTGNNRVLELSPSGTITPIAPAAGLNKPKGVEVDGAGDVFIADTGKNRVLEVSPSGTVTTVNTKGWPLAEPSGVAVDAAGDLFIASGLGIVLKISPSGTVIRIAPSRFNWPSGVALDGTGDIFVADTGADAVWKVVPSGVVIPVYFQLSIDPTGVAVDGAGDVFISDTANNRVLEASPSGQVTPVAIFAHLSGPDGVAVDSEGNLFIADTLRVIEVTAGVFVTVRPATTRTGLGAPTPTAGDGSTAGEGPTVTAIRRSGLHARGTTLVLTFSAALDPARAQDARDYRIVGPRGRIRVVSAVYDPTAMTVALHTRPRLDVHWRYRLTIDGRAPHGLIDTQGRLLAGDNGPGSNFIAVVGVDHPVFDDPTPAASPRHPTPRALAQAAHRIPLGELAAARTPQGQLRPGFRERTRPSAAPEVLAKK